MTEENGGDEQAVFTVVAGPNGSGKSTFVDYLANRGKSLEPFINPDNIAKEIAAETGKDVDSVDVQIKSGRKALDLTKTYIENRQSFSRETTLTSKEILRTMETAKEAGFKVEMVFIGSNNLEINKGRIEERVQRGEHAIPEETQERRFERSYEQASKAAMIADKAVFLHNGVDRFSVVAEVENGKLQHQDQKEAKWLHKVTAHIENEQINDSSKTTGRFEISDKIRDAVNEIQDPERAAQAKSILAQMDHKKSLNLEEGRTPDRSERDDQVQRRDGQDDLELE